MSTSPRHRQLACCWATALVGESRRRTCRRWRHGFRRSGWTCGGSSSPGTSQVGASRRRHGRWTRRGEPWPRSCHGSSRLSPAVAVLGRGWRAVKRTRSAQSPWWPWPFRCTHRDVRSAAAPTSWRWWASPCSSFRVNETRSVGLRRSREPRIASSCPFRVTTRCGPTSTPSSMLSHVSSWRRQPTPRPRPRRRAVPSDRMPRRPRLHAPGSPP